MRKIELAVFDLDNTLYDWYASFLPAFYSMVDTVTSTVECDREVLLDQLRSIHVKYHDVEHPFSLFETPIVRRLSEAKGDEYVREMLDPALYSFNKVRKENLKLFPDARETLSKLREHHIRLVAFTDSSYFATLRRIRQLDLVDAFEQIFCRAKSDSVVKTHQARPSPEDRLASITIELPPDETKPDPRVLIDIAAAERVDVSSTAYIGDSISKDVLMAKKAGCFAVWAKYGVRRDPVMYRQLVRISHWTEQDIQRERNFAAEAEQTVPDFVCEQSIAEILPILCESNSRTEFR